MLTIHIFPAKLHNKKTKKTRRRSCNNITNRKEWNIFLAVLARNKKVGMV